MDGKSSRNKVSIGASSLILIFIVLCMATFGLLSLSSAQGDLKLARRNADAVKGYYEADNKGQQWLKGVDEVLMEEMGKGQDSTQCSLEIKDRLGDLYDRGNRPYIHGYTHGQGPIPSYRTGADVRGKEI